MFKYVKTLEYPINIKKKDLRMARYIITQLGGPNGELGAALRYFSQKFSMPDDRGKALLSDIGCEELGHVEMICTMIRQLIKDASIDEIKKYGLDAWYTQHNKGVFPMDANGSLVKYKFGIGSITSLESSLIKSTRESVRLNFNSFNAIPSIVFNTSSLLSVYCIM